MSQPLVVSIILNSNKCYDTLRCLDALTNNTYVNHTILVLDNASSDGSVPAIRARFPQVRVVELCENRGYTGNNNVGIRSALEMGADWVFVLNEDTFLAPDGLARMVEVGGSDPQIGIVGPMVYHDDEPDVIQSAGGRLGSRFDSIHIAKNEEDHGQFPEPHPVEWISGCAILVRRAVIEQIGLLDERFFYYWEETDWCLRARKQGWKVYHAPQAKLWHKGVQRNYHPSAAVTYYWTRNRFLLMEKEDAPVFMRLSVWWQTLSTIASWSVKPRWRHMRAHRDAALQGSLDYLRRQWGPMPSAKNNHNGDY